MEDGALIIANRDLRMDIVVLAGELENASAAEYRCESLSMDGTFADPQAAVHPHNGSVTTDGSPAAMPEARRRRTLRSPRTFLSIDFDDHPSDPGVPTGSCDGLSDIAI